MALRIPFARSIPNLTPSQLATYLSNSPTPLHLPDLVSHWPAVSSWGLSDGFASIRRAVGENREVEVEVGSRGRGYLDPDVQRVSMGFGLFLEAFILDRIPSTTPPDQLPSAYLAQSDLLDIPSLAADVPPLDHFTSGPQATFYRRTIWIGPSGSFTPFHRDPYIGIYSQSKPTASSLLIAVLCLAPLDRKVYEAIWSVHRASCHRITLLDTCLPQLFRRPARHPFFSATFTKTAVRLSAHSGPVVGKKRFHLLPPEAAPHLQPSTEPRYTNTSTIPLSISRLFPPDTEPPDPERLGFPPQTIEHCRSQLEKAFSLPGACQAEVSAGESVLVPEGWWHSAEGSGGPGIGVGGWFR